jgi:alpha-L-fucosidase 2
MKVFKICVLAILMVFGLVCKNRAQPPYAGRYKAVFTTVPKKVPTAKTPDGPLAGNGDIGLTLGGNPDKLVFYFGKNDFWRAYPVYPGGGIASPGRLEVSIDALKGAKYYAEQLLDKAVIEANFTKDSLAVGVTTQVCATANMVVSEFVANKACIMKLALAATEGNTSITSKGTLGDVTWVTRSFENTSLI